MAILNALPFEFMTRWMDVAEEFGLDHKATAAMDERDRELEDHLATRTLDMLIDVDTTTTAPVEGDTLVYDATQELWLPEAPSGGGSSTVEGFRFTSPLGGTDGTGQIIWDTTTFKSTGVTLTTANARIEVPLGFFHVNFYVYVEPTGTAPSSGAFQVTVFSTGGGGSEITIAASEIAELGFAQGCVSFDMLDTAGTSMVRAVVDDTLDQAVSFTADISGHLVGTSLA